MNDQIINTGTLIDDNSINRFKMRASNTSKVMVVLANDNTEDILKLDTEQRVEERKKQLLSQNLPDVTVERVI